MGWGVRMLLIPVRVTPAQLALVPTMHLVGHQIRNGSFPPGAINFNLNFALHFIA